MIASEEQITVIRPSRTWFSISWKEVWSYRELLWLLAKRDVSIVYKQTILGPAWAVIQPLLTTVVFTIIFGNLAHLTTADVGGEFLLPGFLFYMSGNICWAYFSGTLHATSNTFLANRAIMGKVYYPRLVSPIATALSHLISFSIQFAMFLCFWLFYVIPGGTSIRITPTLLMIPLCILQMIILSTGCGIITVAASKKEIFREKLKAYKVDHDYDIKDWIYKYCVKGPKLDY